MSFDLCVFHTKKRHSDDDAGERHAAYCQEEDLTPWIEPSPQVAAFLNELRAQYPDIDDAPEHSVEECPWAAGFDCSEGHVLMPMVFSWAERMSPVIIGLAEKNGLVCFDPQQGKIVTAPPGLHVEETDEPPLVVPENTKKPAKPLADTLKNTLKPLGYERKGRYWRKDAEKAIIALEAYNDDGIYQIWLYAWFKDLGEVDPGKVGSDGKYHLCRELLGNFVPTRLLYRLLRAFHFGSDYADYVRQSHANDDENQELLGYCEPHEPLTQAWRAKVLREALDDYLLPFCSRIEAGEHKALFAEREAQEAKEREDALAEEIKHFKSTVAKCREWKEEGLADPDIVRNLQRELLTMPSVVVCLCAAIGYSIEVAKAVVAESGVWSIDWKPRDDEWVQEEVHTYDCLVRDGEDRIRLV